MARRYNQTKESISIDKLSGAIAAELENIQQQMFDAAKKILDERISAVSQYEQFKAELENGKMLSCSWCGKQECEDKIKEETGAELRVIPSDDGKKVETCIYCKDNGAANVLFARGY